MFRTATTKGPLAIVSGGGVHVYPLLVYTKPHSFMFKIIVFITCTFVLVIDNGFVSIALHHTNCALTLIDAPLSPIFFTAACWYHHSKLGRCGHTMLTRMCVACEQTPWLQNHEGLTFLFSCLVHGGL